MPSFPAEPYSDYFVGIIAGTSARNRLRHQRDLQFFRSLPSSPSNEAWKELTEGYDTGTRAPVKRVVDRLHGPAFEVTFRYRRPVYVKEEHSNSTLADYIAPAHVTNTTILSVPKINPSLLEANFFTTSSFDTVSKVAPAVVKGESHPQASEQRNHIFCKSPEPKIYPTYPQNDPDIDLYADTDFKALKQQVPDLIVRASQARVPGFSLKRTQEELASNVRLGPPLPTELEVREIQLKAHPPLSFWDNDPQRIWIPYVTQALIEHESSPAEREDRSKYIRKSHSDKDLRPYLGSSMTMDNIMKLDVEKDHLVGEALKYFEAEDTTREMKAKALESRQLFRRGLAKKTSEDNFLERAFKDLHATTEKNGQKAHRLRYNLQPETETVQPRKLIDRSRESGDHSLRVANRNDWLRRISHPRHAIGHKIPEQRSISDFRQPRKDYFESMRNQDRPALERTVPECVLPPLNEKRREYLHLRCFDLERRQRARDLFEHIGQDMQDLLLHKAQGHHLLNSQQSSRYVNSLSPLETSQIVPEHREHQSNHPNSHSSNALRSQEVMPALKIETVRHCSKITFAKIAKDRKNLPPSFNCAIESDSDEDVEPVPRIPSTRVLNHIPESPGGCETVSDSDIDSEIADALIRLRCLKDDGATRELEGATARALKKSDLAAMDDSNHETQDPSLDRTFSRGANCANKSSITTLALTRGPSAASFAPLTPLTGLPGLPKAMAIKLMRTDENDDHESSGEWNPQELMVEVDVRDSDD